MTLAEKDLKYIWHPYTQHHSAKTPIPIIKGDGVFLIDENGNRIIDAVSSWWVTLHGHAHPYIAEKVSQQLSVLEQVIFAGFTHKPAIELAERLIKVVPSNQSKVFYSDNGSTAVEVALKMALQYWYNKGSKKNKIIAFKEAYHGDTFGSMSVSGRSAFTDPFTSLLFDVEYIDVPVNGSVKAQLNKLLKEHDDVAAFIFEPLVLGAGGMLMYESGYLDELIELCQQNKVLTIADEVMTGFGRTGKFFACDHLQHQPDIMCLSKGLTGGTMALGVTTCTKDIFDAFLSDDKMKTLFHGHSFTANPLACTASLASLDLMEMKSTWDQIGHIQKSHAAFKEELLKDYSNINVRHQGTIIAIELKSGSGSYFHEVREVAYTYFLERNILLRPLGNIIYILPPYCITQTELEQVYTVIRDFLNFISVSG